jgi:hypothetical protein
VKIDDSSIEKVEEFKYLGKMLTALSSFKIQCRCGSSVVKIQILKGEK